MRYILILLLFLCGAESLIAKQEQQSLTEILRSVEKAYRIRISFSPTVTDKIYPSGLYPLNVKKNLLLLLNELEANAGVSIRQVGNMYVVGQVKPRIVEKKNQEIPKTETQFRDTVHLSQLAHQDAGLVAANPELPLLQLKFLPVNFYNSGPKMQRWALQTNLLAWATGTINVGVFYTFHSRWSAGAQMLYNPWNFGEVRLKQFSLRPEIRYWLCQSESGHFLSANMQYTRYNIGKLPDLSLFFNDLSNYRFEGDLGGIGIGYGYNWVLGKHLNIGVEAGVGLFRNTYRKYTCDGCSILLEKGRNTFVAPNKMAVNVIFLF